MKNNYEKPEITVTEFTLEDVITESGIVVTPGEGQEVTIPYW